MNLLDKARQLEGQLARGMRDAAKRLVRANGVREPLELLHAIVDTVEREIQAGSRGTRVFPFNTIDISIVAPNEQVRARIDTILNGDVPLAARIGDRLRAAHSAAPDLDVRVTYVPRPHKQWADPQFAIAFSKVARPSAPAVAAEPAAARIELTVLQGTAERKSFVFSSHRIDIGRGHEVRDSHNRLVRTNHLAFTEDTTPVNRTISRQHSHIVHDARTQEFRVHDDGSVQGTRVVRNGKTLPAPEGARGVRLLPGDEIVMGEARVRVTLV
jgi:hypothetical protein